MNLILFHSGVELPVFLKDCFKQIRLFNDTINIYFLTDNIHLKNDIFVKYNIIPIDISNYWSTKIDTFNSLFNYGPNNFWNLAAIRLFYIENFIKKEKLENVYHFENDILLYYSLQEHHKKFVDFYKNISITTGGPDKSMTGFMFIKNYKSLSMMTDFFINTLTMYGVSGTQRKYGMDMVHEMSLMKFYNVEMGEEYISNLPILPFGDFSEHFDDFNSIFDPATWGQFVGGTRNEGPGAKPSDHYIGQLLIKNPSYNVIWKLDNFDRNIPYFKYNGNEVKINNLHIHSKNLNKYLSCE